MSEPDASVVSHGNARRSSSQGAQYGSVARTFIAACLTLSCERALGLDDYVVDDTSDSGHAGSAATEEPPLLPAIPDAIDPVSGEPRVDACRACVETQCGDLYQRCVDSPRCSDMLRCTGICDDPDCIFRCKDTLPESPYYEDYFACAFQGAIESTSRVTSRCFQECQAGGNWDCVGKFSWDSPPDYVPTTIQLIDELGIGETGPLPALRGVTVDACGDGLPTSDPAGDWGCPDTFEPVTAYGEAVLDFGNSTAVVVRDLVSGTGQRVYPRPVTQPLAALAAPVRLFVYATYVTRFTAGSVAPYDPTRGVVQVVQADCLGTEAETDIEIEPQDGATHVRVHKTGIAKLGPDVEYGSNAIFVGVLPDQSVVITGTRIGGEEVSYGSVLVAADWLSMVFLYPKSQQ